MVRKRATATVSATPAGSISMLTRAQASELIDRLSGRPNLPPGHWEARGTVTGRQLGMIVHLCDLIGFTDAEFSAWLSKRFKVGSAREIPDRAVASKLIAGLARMQTNLSAGHLAGSGRRGRKRPPSIALRCVWATLPRL